MKTLNDIRKAIKPLGFTVTTQRFSFGRAATYQHLESGQMLTFNVYNAETHAKWKSLNDWREENHAALVGLQKTLEISGLAKSGIK